MVKETHAAVSSGVKEMTVFVELVRGGGEEVRKIHGQLAAIIDGVKSITPRYEATNTAVQAQSAGARQISDSMVQLSDVAVHNKSALKEFNLAAQKLGAVVDSLTKEASGFRQE